MSIREKERRSLILQDGGILLRYGIGEGFRKPCLEIARSLQMYTHGSGSSAKQSIQHNAKPLNQNTERTNSLTQELTHPPTHSPTHSPTHPLSHTLTHPHTLSLTHPPIHSTTQPLSHTLTHPHTHSPTHLLAYLPIYPRRTKIG